MAKKFAIVLAIVAVIAVYGAIRPLPVVQKLLGAASGLNSLTLTPGSSDTYSIQSNGTTTVDSSGNVVAPVVTAAVTIGSGTAVTRIACGTTSFTVPIFGRRSGTGTGVATTSVTVTNAKIGDPAWVSQNSSTDAMAGQGIINSASAASGSVIVAFSNPTDATTTSITTSTVRACILSVQ